MVALSVVIACGGGLLSWCTYGRHSPYKVTGALWKNFDSGDDFIDGSTNPAAAQSTINMLVSEFNRASCSTERPVVVGKHESIAIQTAVSVPTARSDRARWLQGNCCDSVSY